MLSTEIISIPTGFIFLCVMGTLWKARISFTVPMLFCLAWTFNFLIGGLSGVFLSDVAERHRHARQLLRDGPLPLHDHGRADLRASSPAIYYWVPKMTGLRFNETLAKWHFWLMFIFFNSTFLPLFVLGMKGMPRRVSTYAPNLQGLNDWVSISAFVLGFSMLIFLFNVVYSLIFVREPGRGQPVALEVDRVAAADAGARQQLRADPGVRLRPLRLRHAGRCSRAAASRRRREPERWPPKAKSCRWG